MFVTVNCATCASVERGKKPISGVTYKLESKRYSYQLRLELNEVQVEFSRSSLVSAQRKVKGHSSSQKVSSTNSFRFETSKIQTSPTFCCCVYNSNQVVPRQSCPTYKVCTYLFIRNCDLTLQQPTLMNTNENRCYLSWKELIILKFIQKTHNLTVA